MSMRAPRRALAALGRAVRALDDVALGARLDGMTLDVARSARLHRRGVTSKEGCALVVGADALVEGSIAFDRPGARVIIGARTFMNGRIVAAERVVIGDDVLVAWGVTIVDHHSHALAFSKRSRDVVLWGRGEKDWTHVSVAPVTIADKVWIGFDAIVLAGVQIGVGAIVGAGSVVTKDVAPWTVVAGNPARVIRTLGEDER